ncbi:MAG: DNA alkylation repair protein [Spirochaetes bacterium RBG_16_67_19]|nr:MAG: DNA alkylation repair protein [Spirochaetes bacterium RBG_16_67_19]
MLTLAQIMKRLRAAARPDQLEGMARYGINPRNRLGVSMPELRALAKAVGKDHRLALQLWDSGIPDARILASIVDEPEEVTEAQMETWARGLDSWDVCDQVCLNLFDKTPFAPRKIARWAGRQEEFVKRAAFSLIACLAWHDKKAADFRFLSFLPLIRSGATDERNLVKKAVSWALRHIGKRNLNLHRAALQTAGELQALDSKSARWIAAQALRELQSEAVRKRLRKQQPSPG